MPTYRDEAVVLRTQKLGEADRIVTLLSKSHGKFRAVAKGVRRTASKFGSRLEPFMVADMQFYVGRSLDTVTQAETLGSYGAEIVSDYQRYTTANVMVETADRLTDAEASPSQYLLLIGALRSLARNEHPPTLTLNSYLLRAMSLAGWAPAFDACAKCGLPGLHSHFVVQLGGVLCRGCAPTGSVSVRPEALDLCDALVRGEWPRAEAHDARTTSQVDGLIAAYAQWHMDKNLRSLEHIAR